MSADTVKSIAERRVRRQKIFIAVGSVVLLAVLGFELPKVLGGKGNEGVGITTLSSTAASASAAAPAVPAGQLPATDRVVVQRDSNQLISFGLFKSKDPFVQQLSETTPSGPSTPPPANPPTSTTPDESTNPPVLLLPIGGPDSTTTAPSTPSVVPPGTTTPSTPETPPAVPTDALIATNGVCERIAANGTFPTNENIFRLVSIAKDGKSVQIGIVGGSFDSGQPTATLKVGEKLTLVNTADGTRYVIELKAKCVLETPPGGTQTTTSSSTPTTPIAPAPTTPTTTTTTDTVTTPIVTDADDTPPPSS
jgi:hypothetical protein